MLAETSRMLSTMPAMSGSSRWFVPMISVSSHDAVGVPQPHEQRERAASRRSSASTRILRARRPGRPDARDRTRSCRGARPGRSRASPRRPGSRTSALPDASITDDEVGRDPHERVDGAGGGAGAPSTRRPLRGVTTEKSSSAGGPGRAAEVALERVAAELVEPGELRRRARRLRRRRGASASRRG